MDPAIFSHQVTDAAALVASDSFDTLRVGDPAPLFGEPITRVTRLPYGAAEPAWYLGSSDRRYLVLHRNGVSLYLEIAARQSS